MHTNTQALPENTQHITGIVANSLPPKQPQQGTSMIEVNVGLQCGYLQKLVELRVSARQP